MNNQIRTNLFSPYLWVFTGAVMLSGTPALFAQSSSATRLQPLVAGSAGGQAGQEKFLLKGHTNTVESLEFSPDGNQLATGSFDDTIKLWDTKSGLEIRTLKGHTDRVRCITYSPDGKRIASASADETAKVWDVSSGKVLLTLKQAGRDSCPLLTVAFSPDGKRLAMGGGSFHLMMWDAWSGQQLFTVNLNVGGSSGSIDHIRFSPDGKRLAFQNFLISKWVSFRDSSNGERVSGLYTDNLGSFQGLAFSPDGKRLVTANDGLNIWDAASNARLIEKPLATIKNTITKTANDNGNEITSVTWSADGRWFASGDRDYKVKVWDAASGQLLLTLTGHAPPGRGITSVAFSPDGNLLASSADYNATVRVWDLTPISANRR